MERRVSGERSFLFLGWIEIKWGEKILVVVFYRFFGWLFCGNVVVGSVVKMYINIGVF